MLALIYLIVLVVFIVALVRLGRQKLGIKWLVLFLCEGGAIVVASGLTLYFNDLPGTGMMPGLTWFGETLSSMAAMVGYWLVMTVTLVVWLVKYFRGKGNSGK